MERNFPEALCHILDDQVADIYRKYYWGRVAGSALPDGLDFAVFDTAVNTGPARPYACYKELSVCLLMVSSAPRRLLQWMTMSMRTACINSLLLILKHARVSIGYNRPMCISVRAGASVQIVSLKLRTIGVRATSLPEAQTPPAGWRVLIAYCFSPIQKKPLVWSAFKPAV